MTVACADCKHLTMTGNISCCKLKMRVIRSVKETEYVECEIMRRHDANFITGQPLCGPEGNLFESIHDIVE